MYRYARNLVLLLGLAWSLLYPCNSYAAYPFTFSNGTTSDATAVNADLDYFENKFSPSSGHDHDGTNSKQISLAAYTWVGNPITATYGGTGNNLSSAVQGSVLYAQATGDITALPPSTAGKYLRSNGTFANPSFETVVQRIVQVVNVETGAMATGSTVIPNIDSIPQQTDGDEYMTLAITPTSATNKLKIDVVFDGSRAGVGGSEFTLALFQDATAGALAATSTGEYVNPDQFLASFSHYMTAGTTSSTTFKVRAGFSVAGTVTFNGLNGARKLGGVIASSITITEITP